MPAVQLVCSKLLLVVACLSSLAGCGNNPAPVAPAAMPPEPGRSAEAPPPEQPHEHHHEMKLPPVGPQMSVAFDGRQVELTLTELSHGSATIPLLDLWRAAYPNQDPTPLIFDLFGSDGFHPSARPPCARPLTAQLLATAHINVVSHDITFDPKNDLPGCYRVHAVVRFEGRAAGGGH